MKKTLIISVLVSLMSLTVLPSAAQHHRHHQSAATIAVQQAKGSEQGIEAYSDTTSSDTAFDVAADDTLSTYSKSSPSWGFEDSIDDFLDGDMTFSKLLGLGVGGILISVLIMGILFLVTLLPVICFVWFLWWIMKRNRKKIMNAATSMETGVDPCSVGQTPQDGNNVRPTAIKSQSQVYWEKGVMRLSIGVGLAIVGMCWAYNFIFGVGVIVGCYGAGLIIISRRQGRNEEGNSDKANF